MQGLAPSPAAAIENSVAGQWVEVGSNALGPAVLHFVPAVLEALQVLQARTLGQYQCLGCDVANFCGDSLASEAVQHRLTVGLKAVCPENYLGRTVERRSQCRPVFPEFCAGHFVEPGRVALGQARS